MEQDDLKNSPDLEDFLADLQDALLTGDQDYIIETKKKYNEQVFLHKKKKTDAEVSDGISLKMK